MREKLTPPPYSSCFARRYSLKYGIDLPQSVTPFFGKVEGYDVVGEVGDLFMSVDEEALDEIRGMIEARKKQ